MRLIPGGAHEARLIKATAHDSLQRARSGLAEVVAGTDTAAGWRWRTPGERLTARGALVGTTLLLCVVSAASMHPSAAAQPLAVWQRGIAVVAIAPLPLAARYPLLAWRAGWAGLLLVPLLPAHWWGGWPWGPAQVLAMLAALCLAGIRYQRAVLWWMWALTLGPWFFWLSAREADLNGPIGAAAVFTAVIIALDSLAVRALAERDLAAQAEVAEAERAQRAVLEERTRIARELHDVVAHHMSLIAVQAETAPYRLSGLSDAASAEFGSISATAREAMTDMRRLLGVLRRDEAPGLTPQPQLADVPALVDAARRAGVSVDLSTPAGLAPVSAGVGVCAYRIIQESLSNASQHAPGAAVTVSVRQDGDEVLLQVANGPGVPTASSGRERGPGHGLTGMRERVALLGGSLSAGPAADGGFVVSAILPLGHAS